MPSPFPGMDPYLENPAVWKGLHLRLINHASDLLQAQLRTRGYYVDVNERVWLQQFDRAVFPDVAVIRQVRAQDDAQTATAIAEPDEPVVIKRADVEVHEPHLEIFDASGNRLVTGIEFISPAIKAPTTGRRLYETKRDQLAEGGVNLVEIDLLRSGRHLVGVPEPMLESLGRYDYLVNTIRAGCGDIEVYPIRVRSQLPRIRIPLKPTDSDAVLDLQLVLDRAYDAGPYPERLDYSSGPSTPLNEDDANWAAQLLKDKGLRQ